MAKSDAPKKATPAKQETDAAARQILDRHVKGRRRLCGPRHVEELGTGTHLEFLPGKPPPAVLLIVLAPVFLVF